jgi:Fur family peroxide stress response transcriptional regulator
MSEGMNMSGKTDGTAARDVSKNNTDAFLTRCREKGLKITPQRMAVYQALLETDEHPSAETVFRRVRRTFSSISLDTVNRTLATLSEIGLAFAVEGSGDARRYDANLENHQHFKCLACKRIVDFHHKPFDRIHVPKTVRNKFTIVRKTVYLEGFCNRCKDSPNPT